MFRTGRVVRWTAGALGLAVGGYAAYVANAWLRYGRVASPQPDEVDPLLDHFMPDYDVAERHHVRVAAPAAIALSAATAADLQQSAIVRGLFRARELVLRAQTDAVRTPVGLLEEMESLGWRILAEEPGREIVVGAVTQPWLPNVAFHGLRPDDFRTFREPDCVKIVWTLRADPVGPSESVFRTETRVATTDPAARRKFRWYWARFSPGIILIRWFLLANLKKDAERRAHAGHTDVVVDRTPGDVPHRP